MKFYRYEAREYAFTGADGEYVTPAVPNVSLELQEFNLHKETPKGYWIGYGKPDKLSSPSKWISKTSKKRYAYPTKEEALNNFIKRTEKRMSILKRQILACSIAVGIAKNKTTKNEVNK